MGGMDGSAERSTVRLSSRRSLTEG